MILRLATLALLLVFAAAPARAQNEKQSFAAFQAGPAPVHVLRWRRRQA